jgi:hypothetical protein
MPAAVILDSHVGLACVESEKITLFGFAASILNIKRKVIVI